MADLLRLGRSAARLARTRYPSFLFGRDVRSGEIPIFTYHDVESDVLDGDLRFLALNGYRTLSLDEYRERMRAGAAHADKWQKPRRVGGRCSVLLATRRARGAEGRSRRGHGSRAA